jgi:hypothetical protein
MGYTIEQGSSFDNVCECCGDKTRVEQGLVSDAETAVVAYFVTWTPGRLDSHGAFFDMIVGAWGEGTDTSDRVAVSLELGWVDGDPQFYVRDAANRPVARSSLVSRALLRNEVLGTELTRSGRRTPASQS